MPDMTGSAATFQASGYAYQLYASYMSQDIVCQCSANGSPNYSTNGSILSVTVDNVTTGSTAAALVGYTIEVQTSAGVHKGWLRVAHGGGSGSTIAVNEHSPSDVEIVDNDLLIVRADRRIWDKLVLNAASLNKDSRIAYSDQNANQPPIAHSGGPVVGFISGSTLTANFYGSTSKNVDPDSGSTQTHSWTFPGATPSSSTDADPTGIAFPAGPAIWASHQVTDSSNSKSTTQRIPVFVHDTGANAPIKLSRCSLSYSEDTGWSGEIQIAQESQAAASAIPDGSLIVVWAVATHSAGSNVTGRSHIKMVGYLDAARIRIDPDTNEVTFTVISPLGVLAKTPALSQIAIQKNVPTRWSHLKGLTIGRMLTYLMQWHNTYLDIHDFLLPASGDLAYTRLAAGVTSSQLEQFKDIAGSMGYVVTCDRLGRLIVQTEPQYEDTSARSSRTTAYNYALADLIELDWTEPYHYQSKTVVLEGITPGSTASANKPIFSRAPGTAPASRGLNVETLGKQICTQAVGNTRAGLHFARINSLYNGRVVPKGMEIVLPSGYDFIDPAYLEFLTFTVPSTTNARGRAFTTDTKWIARSANINYNPESGTIEPRYTIDHETYGPAGRTEIRKQPSNSGVPSFPPIDLYFPGWDFPPLNTGTLGTGVLLIVTNAGVALTTSFDNPEAAGGPVWAETSSATLGIDGAPMDAVVDPYSPQYLGTGTIIYVYIATTTEIGRLAWDRSDDSLTYASQHTFATAITTPRRRNIQTTRGVQNLVVCMTNYHNTGGSTGSRSIASTDGTTWGSEVTLTTDYNSQLSLSNGLYVGRTGDILTSIPTSTAASVTFVGRKSTNNGASYAAMSSPNLSGAGLAGCIHVPWHDNASETLAYYGAIQQSTFTSTLYRANGATRTDITPTDASGNRYTARRGRDIHTPDNNRARVAVAGNYDPANTANDRWAVFCSDDSGTTWTQVSDAEPDSGTPFTAVNVAENGTVYAWGAADIAVGQWNDLLTGGGFDSRYGNLTAGLGILNIIGG